MTDTSKTGEDDHSGARGEDSASRGLGQTEILPTTSNPDEIQRLWSIASSSDNGHYISCDLPDEDHPLYDRWNETHKAAIDLINIGGDGVFSLVEQALSSDDEWKQQVGMRIGREIDELRPEQLDLFRSRVASFINEDTSDDVFFEAIGAAGFVWDDDAFKSIYELVTDPDPNVREAIAWSINSESQKSVEALSRLSDDPASPVRSIATWKMGTMMERNCQQLRDALRRRLDDKHDETRWEAILGLARRKDTSAIPAIMREFESDFLNRMVVQAAGLFAKPEFIENLEWFDESTGGQSHDDREWALARCRGENDAENPDGLDFVESLKDNGSQ